MLFYLLGTKAVFGSRGCVSCKQYVVMSVSILCQVKGFESLDFFNLYSSNCAFKVNSFGKLFFLEVLRNQIRRQRKTYSCSLLWINDFG